MSRVEHKKKQKERDEFEQFSNCAMQKDQQCIEKKRTMKNRKITNRNQKRKMALKRFGKCTKIVHMTIHM